jgi:hypothetical protein
VPLVTSLKCHGGMTNSHLFGVSKCSLLTIIADATGMRHANSTKSQKGSPTDHVGDEEKKCPPTPAMATINKKKERKRHVFCFFVLIWE